jgi:hypothetical protein
MRKKGMLENRVIHCSRIADIIDLGRDLKSSRPSFPRRLPVPIAEHLSTWRRVARCTCVEGVVRQEGLGLVLGL